MEGKGNVLAMSSVEHLVGTQAVMLSVILSLPVVHWQFVSVREQLVDPTAVAKQASCAFVLVDCHVLGLNSVLRGFGEAEATARAPCGSEKKERVHTAQVGIPLRS